MFDLSALNPEQREAVQTIEGPVFILAGAGTGKTRVITCRIAHMIRRGVSPTNILAVTFTNKAAREMKERVAQMIPKGPGANGKAKREMPFISTFHSLGVSILRQHIELLGFKRNFVIYDDSDQLGLIKKLLSHISTKADDKADPKLVLAMLSRLKNGSLDPTRFAGDGSAALARHIQQRYASALRACNAVDFDDLLLLTLQLLEEHPQVLEACRERFRYVMVDEYQDTNPSQFRILQLLTERHRNLCVVGDDDQSIYGWRGAEIANLLELEKTFQELKVIKLEQNYRSTNTILAAANAVIKNNVRRRSKQLWSSKGQGDKILIHSFPDDEHEAKGIVEEIQYAQMGRKVRWGDMAILFRTNQQSRAFEMALRHAQIKYRVVGGQSYFDRREIRDVLAYLKFLSNPHDEASLLRIVNVPARGLSDATMQKLLAASQERHCSVYTAMKHTDVQEQFPKAAQQSIRDFIELAERARQQLTAEPPVLLSAWASALLAEINYDGEIKRSEKKIETAESRIRNVAELVASLDGQEGKTPLEQLQDFLDDMMLDRDKEEEKETHGNMVTLITMHSCKGLEFPHVFVVGVEEGILPHARSKVEGTMDEERRLFYVAITRAMQTLQISYSLGRKRYGQTLPAHPSQFLNELPADLVEHADELKKKPVAAAEGKSYFSALREAVN